jgi:hypothetical protein
MKVVYQNSGGNDLALGFLFIGFASLIYAGTWWPNLLPLIAGYLAIKYAFRTRLLGHFTPILFLLVLYAVEISPFPLTDFLTGKFIFITLFILLGFSHFVRGVRKEAKWSN